MAITLSRKTDETGKLSNFVDFNIKMRIPDNMKDCNTNEFLDYFFDYHYSNTTKSKHRDLVVDEMNAIETQKYLSEIKEYSVLFLLRDYLEYLDFKDTTEENDTNCIMSIAHINKGYYDYVMSKFSDKSVLDDCMRYFKAFSDFIENNKEG